jgi:squalene synthase HpnC
MDHRTAQAYAACRAIAAAHYENFPVASLLLPAAMRAPVAAVYAFARRADDYADEGRQPSTWRLAQLATMGKALRQSEAGQPPDDPVFIALAHAIPAHGLPTPLFLDLLSAFSQDVVTTRYAHHAEVLDYCRRSANPVGRLLLHIARQTDPQQFLWSDAICSALQLINFMQDIQQDWHEQGRLYLPQDEMAAAGVSEDDIAAARNTPAVQALVRSYTQRARDLLASGAPLGRTLPGRFGLEIRAIVAGGLTVADKLLSQRADIYTRPRLSRLDRLWLAARAALPWSAAA